MKLVAVGSKNPVKIGAVRVVMTTRWPDARVEGIDVASTVSDQPFGDDETIRGAVARAVAAREALGATLGVGLEGGVVEQPDGTMRTCAWAAIVDATGKQGVGGSLSIPLPSAVAAHIREGAELGHAMDRLIGAHDTKHGVGAVGILTDGLVDRQRAYEVLVSYALAPFLTPTLYGLADRQVANRCAARLGIFADDGRAEQALVGRTEKQFDETILVADDLPRALQR